MQNSNWSNEGLPLYRGPGYAPVSPHRYRKPCECVASAYAMLAARGKRPTLGELMRETGIETRSTVQQCREKIERAAKQSTNQCAPASKSVPQSQPAAA